MAKQYICYKCRHLYQKPEKTCNFCGQVFSILPLLGKGKRSDGVSSAKEIFDNKTKRTRPINGFEFLGTVPKTFSILLYGEPGGGKSTFALILGNKLSEIRRTLYATAEERRTSESLELKIKQNHLESKNLFIVEIKTAKQAVNRGIELYCPNVILDSITVMSIGETKMEMLTRAFSGVTIFIAHSTKVNSFRGNRGIEHLVDISLRVDDGIITTKKNRFGGKEKFLIFDDEANRCQKEA